MFGILLFLLCLGALFFIWDAWDDDIGPWLKRRIKERFKK